MTERNDREPLPDSLRRGIRQAMAGLIPEHQEVVDDDTVYCRPCRAEYDYTPSVLSVHNMRRHEYHPDIYDYESYGECRTCGEATAYERAESENGTGLKACSECGALQ